MCVIIHKIENNTIDYNTIKKCYNHNPDGAGIAIRQGDQFVVVKGLFNLTDVWDIIRYSMAAEMIIHFRIRSAGDINKAMTHPFDIGNNINKLYYQSRNMLFHNGSNITCVDYKTNPSISDTYKLAVFLKNTDKLWENVLKIEEKKTQNKYVLIKDGNIIRFGKWEKHRDNWFSNMYWDWKPRSYIMYDYKKDQWLKYLEG